VRELERECVCVCVCVCVRERVCVCVKLVFSYETDIDSVLRKHLNLSLYKSFFHFIESFSSIHRV